MKYRFLVQVVKQVLKIFDAGIEASNNPDKQAYAKSSVTFLALLIFFKPTITFCKILAYDFILS